MAARNIGLSTVPVYVLPATAADTAAETIDRIVHQMVTNDHERDLTDAQRARAIQQMIDAGLSVTKVAKKLSVGKDTVKAAQTAATSSVALEALEGGQISLSEAAVLTEFEHDGAEPLDRLVAAAGTPRFDHVVAQLRAERASAQAYAQAVADYTERGFTILDDDARWGWRLDRVPLRHLQRDGDDGEPEALDESVITDPQHWAVRLEEYTEYVDADGNVIDEGDIDWDTEGEPDAEPEEGLRHADSVVERTAFAPEWFCLNPEAAGVRISETYQRNAEYFARDRSTQSRTAQAISTTTPAMPTARPPAHAPKRTSRGPKARAAHCGQPQQTRCRRHRRAPPVRHHAAGPQDPSQRRGIIRRGLPGTRQLHAHPTQPRRGRRRAARHRRGQGARGGQRPARKQRQPCPGDRAGAGLGCAGGTHRQGRVAQPRTGPRARRRPHLLRAQCHQR